MAKLLQMSLLFEALLEDPANIAEPPSAKISSASLQPPPPDSVPNTADVADAAERNAALDIRRSWIVEAPAGSGKTGLLIQRFLKLLAYGGVEQPDEVLAITFTRKAGAEMRHRVLAQLTAANSARPLSSEASPFEHATRQLAEAALAQDRAFGWGLLANPRQLNIRTIDSFCAELAGSLPLTAGVGGRFTPTNDPDPLYRLAAERTLLHLGGGDATLSRDLELLLLHRDAQPGDFIALLADMLKQREQWGELVLLSTEKLSEEELDEQVRPRLTRTLQRLISRELQELTTRIGPDLLRRLSLLAHQLSTCTGVDGAPSPLELCHQRPHAPSSSAEDLPHWLCLAHLLLKADGDWRKRASKGDLGFIADKGEQQELLELIAAFSAREASHPGLRDALCSLKDLPDPVYPEDQWRNVKALCRTLRHGLLELQLVFAERHTCDFSEIALNARALLRSNINGADLLNTSIGKLKHLLVDEMQDTSAPQYELLERLTGTWDGSTQTLFLVGDPKQSIYEFRQARVERFRTIIQERRLGQLTIHPLRLSANFRSQAALVHGFNATFEQIFPAPNDPILTADSVDVPFIAATPTRSAGSPEPLHWHFTMGDPPSSPETEPEGGDPGAPGNASFQPSESRVIRDTIEAYLANWPLHLRQRPPRIAVLARNRAHLAPIIQEFHQDRGRGTLPFRAVDVEALNERPEILDLLALTRALLDPADRVACLAVLRSPVCGLSLHDLLALTGDGPEADLLSTVQHLVSERADRLSFAGQYQLARAWPILQQSIQSLGRTPLSTHLERTWRTLGGDAPLRSHERRNARRFLDLIYTLESGSEPFTLSLLNRRLKVLYAEPNSPQAPVELMTIHKAKGLEWDLVLIPAMQRGSGTNTHEFLKWLEFTTPEGEQEFLLSPIQGKGENSHKLSAWLGQRQTRRRAAEAKRLVYVACTRAREELHLFATLCRKADGTLQTPKRADSLLAAAWPAAQQAFHRQQDSAVAAPQTATVITLPLTTEAHTGQVLSLAAAADPSAPSNSTPKGRSLPQRLPPSFDATRRFTIQPQAHLPYLPPENLPNAALFARPEGSFTTRAFGNALHRFLQVLSDRFAAGQDRDALLNELPGWQGRLQTVLRSEGLAPAQAAREAGRALAALQATLRDPEGMWLLSPQLQARNEAALPVSSRNETASLRSDRMFLATAVPNGTGDPTHLWIIDYKTAEPGGRNLDSFLSAQRAKYEQQMDAYAQAAISAGQDPHLLILALYFPLLPSLLWWSYKGK